MWSDFREIQLKVSSHEPDQRLDRYLARQVAGISRTRIQALMEAGLITIDGAVVKPSQPVRTGEIVLIRIPGPEPSPLLPQSIPLDVRFEDEHLIVINKPAGMVVHPAHGHPDGTLVNALLHHCLSPRAGLELSPQTPLKKGGLSPGTPLSEADLSPQSPLDKGSLFPGTPLTKGGWGGSTARPGLVHRLDKDTSGLLVVAKTDAALAGLAKQFKQKTALRRYRALVWGHLYPAEGRIDAPLGRSPRDRKKFSVLAGGKEAATRYKTLEKFELLSLMELQLETGRTHQIRIHMQHANHPVFGDPQYGGRNRRLGALTSAQREFVANLFEVLPRQALHAGVLGFIHPATGAELVFESDFPEDLKTVLDYLRSRSSG